MAFLSYPNVRIVGVSACVPKEIESNRESSLIPENEREKLINTTGIEEKRVVPDGVCSSDLCFHAAEKLIDELNWSRSEIDALIFVSQTHDYILPATSCILQHRLGLSKECLAFDVNLGCSGWVYGINCIASILNSGSIKKALLLCGDLASRTQSSLDKTSYPLFGDAGTCTALIHDVCDGIRIHLATDGEGYDAIIIPDGGYRNPTNPNSLIYQDLGQGKVLTRLHTNLDGLSVFSFAISQAPKSVKKLCSNYDIDQNQVDFYFFHQANMQLNETIRKKLKLPEYKVPYSLQKFANSSCATIPITMVTQCRDRLQNTKLKNIACAFGVGLSWGSVYFETDHIVVPKLIEI